MSHINEKLGLRPAGQRSMMKGLPKNRAEAAIITAAKCPQCQRTGARLSKTQPGKLYCTVCNHIYDVPEATS